MQKAFDVFAYASYSVYAYLIRSKWRRKLTTMAAPMTVLFEISNTHLS